MTKTRLNKFANNIQKENIVYVSQMGFSVHAQGPYKHLTPGNPDFFLKKKKKRCKVSVFQPLLRQASFSSKAPLAGGEMKASASTAKGPWRWVLLPSSLPSTPSSSRFLSPLGANVSVSLSLHHSADRRVRQVELARDVSGWVLLQRWRENGGEGWRQQSFLDKSCIFVILVLMLV